MDQLARENPPKAPLLDEVLQILKQCKIVEEQQRIDNGNTSSVNDWSVFSEFCSESSEDDFDQRLKDVDKGIKLKRRSTLVSSFGFKFTEHCAPITTEKSKEKFNETSNVHNPHKHKNLLKGVVNKRKLNAKHVRSEAFYFMNQLGKKLRRMYSNNKMPIVSLKDIEKISLENHEVESRSSNFSSMKDEPQSAPLGLLMSPIKRRKEIGSPRLNAEQSNFLDICTIYKAGDFLSISNTSEKKQRNSSATPINRTENLLNKNSNNANEEIKSCTKLSLQKTKRRKKKAKLISKKSSQKRLPKESDDSILQNKKTPKPDIYRNMISLNFTESEPVECKPVVKSPKRKVRKSKKTKKMGLNPHRHMGSVEISQNVIEGLSSILADMEKESVKPKVKASDVNRRRSKGENNGPKLFSGISSKRKGTCALPSNPKQRMHTCVDLETIVASLGKILIVILSYSNG